MVDVEGTEWSEGIAELVVCVMVQCGTVFVKVSVE